MVIFKIYIGGNILNEIETYRSDLRHFDDHIFIIRMAGVPEYFNKNFLGNLGFKETESYLYIKLFSALELIDKEGRPEEDYYQLVESDTKSRLILAKKLKVCYKEVFEKNKYIHRLPYDEITAIIREVLEGKKEEKIIRLISDIFFVLSEYAIWEEDYNSINRQYSSEFYRIFSQNEFLEELMKGDTTHEYQPIFAKDLHNEINIVDSPLDSEQKSNDVHVFSENSDSFQIKNGVHKDFIDPTESQKEIKKESETNFKIDSTGKNSNDEFTNSIIEVFESARNSLKALENNKEFDTPTAEALNGHNFKQSNHFVRNGEKKNGLNKDVDLKFELIAATKQEKKKVDALSKKAELLLKDEKFKDAVTVYDQIIELNHQILTKINTTAGQYAGR